MIEHLAKIFLRQERYYGFPSAENTQKLNEWEDSAIDYLPTGVYTPARAIELDDTGWHATHYTAIWNEEEFDAGHFSELLKWKSRRSAALVIISVPETDDFLKDLS